MGEAEGIIEEEERELIQSAIEFGDTRVGEVMTPRTELAWIEIGRAHVLDIDDDVNLYCGARLNDDEIVVIGRRGGPEFLESELARLGHLVGLATSIVRAG